MLQRLAAAISAELTAIESAERRADDNRRVRYAVAIGFVSAAAIPIGLILAFLSTSTSQVNRAWSMFSHHYLGLYLAVVAIVVDWRAAMARTAPATTPRRRRTHPGQSSATMGTRTRRYQRLN